MKIKTYCVIYTQFNSVGDGRICNITKITTFDNLTEARQYYIAVITELLKLDYDKLEEIDKNAIDEEIKSISETNLYRDSINDDFAMELIESE